MAIRRSASVDMSVSTEMLSTVDMPGTAVMPGTADNTVVLTIYHSKKTSEWCYVDDVTSTSYNYNPQYHVTETNMLQ